MWVSIKKLLAKLKLAKPEEKGAIEMSAGQAPIIGVVTPPPAIHPSAAVAAAATVPVITPLPWWVSFSISSGIAALHMALRNPQYAANLQETMLELRDAINASYPGQ